MKKEQLPQKPVLVTKMTIDLLTDPALVIWTEKNDKNSTELDLE